MKTSASLRKRRNADRAARSFALALCVYAPLVGAFIWAAPAETLRPAGNLAAVSLTFAQIAGGAATAAEAPAPLAAEPAATEPAPEPEAVPEPEAPAAEPAPEPEPTPEPVPEPEPEPAPAPEPPPPPPKAEPKPRHRPEVRRTAERRPEARRERTREAHERKPRPAVAAASAAAPAASAGTAGTPGGATASAEGGVSTLVWGETSDPFLSEVKRCVEAALRYPRKARVFRIEGTAVVQFTVGTDGRLSELRLHASAGHPLLDKAAMRAVADAESAWSRPRGVTRLRFPIRFEFRG